jgi:hypothetical protein
MKDIYSMYLENWKEKEIRAKKQGPLLELGQPHKVRKAPIQEAGTGTWPCTP